MKTNTAGQAGTRARGLRSPGNRAGLRSEVASSSRRRNKVVEEPGVLRLCVPSTVGSVGERGECAEDSAGENREEKLS